MRMSLEAHHCRPHHQGRWGQRLPAFASQADQYRRAGQRWPGGGAQAAGNRRQEGEASAWPVSFLGGRGCRPRAPQSSRQGDRASGSRYHGGSRGAPCQTLQQAGGALLLSGRRAGEGSQIVLEDHPGTRGRRHAVVIGLSALGGRQARRWRRKRVQAPLASDFSARRRLATSGEQQPEGSSSGGSSRELRRRASAGPAHRHRGRRHR